MQCDLYAYDAGNDPPQAPHAVISIEENRETQDFDDNNNPERHEIAVVDNKDNSVRSEIKENTDEEVRNVNEMK